MPYEGDFPKPIGWGTEVSRNEAEAWIAQQHRDVDGDEIRGLISASTTQAMQEEVQRKIDTARTEAMSGNYDERPATPTWRRA